MPAAASPLRPGLPETRRESFLARRGGAGANRMETKAGFALGLAVVLLPWVVLVADALFLGFHFVVALLMMVVFAIGVMFLAAVLPESA